MQNIKGKNFLALIDYSREQIEYLLKLSHNLKAQKYNGIINRPLEGKSIVLLFQKDSTRTRCAFEVGASDLGMKTVYLGPSGSQFGKKESVADSAKVLGRMFDGIQFRGFKQSDVEILAKHSNVPVWNGLTDEWHPTQMIADFMTIQEVFGTKLAGKTLAYCGDARNNVANSLMITSAKLGVNFIACAPKELFPDPELVKKARKIALKNNSTIKLEIDQIKAMKNVDVVYTDVWVSMGEENWDSRLKLLHEYQVNMKMIQAANSNVIFLHCLPAFHDKNTTTSKMMGEKYGNKYPNVANGEFEVSDEVISSDFSKVFDQAENRLHSIKAIMLATIGQ